MITLLAEQVTLWINRVPVHVSRVESKAPRVRISPKDGSIEFYEEPRPGVNNAVA
jgi:hypothetical protein